MHILAYPGSRYIQNCLVPVPPPKPAQRALASFLNKWGSCSCTACAGANSSTRATVLKDWHVHEIPWSGFSGYSAIKAKKQQLKKAWTSKTTTQRVDIRDIECILAVAVAKFSGCGSMVSSSTAVAGACRSDDQQVNADGLPANLDCTYFWEMLHENK